MTSIYEAEQRIRDGRRKPTASDKILKALQAAGSSGLLNHQIQDISGALSWHRRIGNLRDKGWDIECIKLKKGEARYILHTGSDR